MALSGTGGWLDDRFHGARGVRTLMHKVFPDHWSFMLGEIALWSFVILLLTGTYLALFFVPSTSDVVYHGAYTKLDGITMSQAYQSTLNISFDVRGGLLIRQIHHWAADLFMVAIIVHMLRVFFTGAYRKPREVNWLIGIVLFTLGPDRGAVRVLAAGRPAVRGRAAGARGDLQGIPIVGTYASYFLFGGAFPGDSIIPRMYLLHVFLIPGIILALITAHLFIMFHQKHTQMPALGNTEKNVVGQPFFPYFLLKGQAWFFFIFGGAGPAGDVRADQPGLGVRAVHAAGDLVGDPARLLPGPAGRRAADHAPVGDQLPRAHAVALGAGPGAAAAGADLRRGGAVAVLRAVGDRRQVVPQHQRPASRTPRSGPRPGWRRWSSTGCCGARAPTTSSPTSSRSRCTR